MHVLSAQAIWITDSPPVERTCHFWCTSFLSSSFFYFSQILSSPFDRLFFATCIISCMFSPSSFFLSDDFPVPSFTHRGIQQEWSMDMLRMLMLWDPPVTNACVSPCCFYAVSLFVCASCHTTSCLHDSYVAFPICFYPFSYSFFACKLFVDPLQTNKATWADDQIQRQATLLCSTVSLYLLFLFSLLFSIMFRIFGCRVAWGRRRSWKGG